MSLLLLLLLALVSGIPGSSSEESGEGFSDYGPEGSSGGRVFVLEEGDFVTYPPGKAKPGDTIVCLIEGKRIEAPVPKRGAGVSIDPMFVGTKPNGEVRAECGGIHAETAPPGSW